MYKLIIVLVAIIGIFMATAFINPKPVKCSDCGAQSCSFDLDCNIGCSCLKKGYNLNGVCF